MVMAEIYDIFISYRRDGGFATANHLNDLLVRDGYTVSFDIDTLREGDFDKELLKRIDQCTDFILIVDKNAFDRTLDPDFDPNKDWLRIELAYALKMKKNVITILLSGVNGFPSNLPKDISDVVTKNGPEYTKSYFDEFYLRLKEFLHCVPRKPKIPDDKATVTFNSDIDTIVYVDGEEITKINAGGYAKIQIIIGEHIFNYHKRDDSSLEYSETLKLDNKRNYVVEIKSWKFTVHRYPTWIKVGLGIIILLFVLGGIYSLYQMNNNSLDEKKNAPIEMKDSIVVTVTDSLITKPTLGKMFYLYTGPIDNKQLPHGHGVAKFKDDNGSLVGTFCHGIINGNDIKQDFKNGDVFKGVVKNNQYESGEYIWKEGEIFKGTFLNGEPYAGNYYNANGDINGIYDKGKYKSTN